MENSTQFWLLLVWNSCRKDDASYALHVPERGEPENKSRRESLYAICRLYFVFA